MSAAPPPARRLAAVLVADVVGFSRLMHEDEAGTLAALKERRTVVVEPLARQHAGRIVKYLGDGVLIEFASAVGSVAFALDLQWRMGELNEPIGEEHRILLRVGINLGDVIGEGSDIYGDGVNIASRLEALAEPGGICVSAKVYDEVKGRLELQAEEMGERALRNIAGPVRCWRISPPRPMGAGPVTTSGQADRISIAVLPFTNMSGDAPQEHFADGLTEDLITALAKFRFLSVLSRNATFRYKGSAVDIPVIARQLGARYVLEGSVRAGGSRTRITAQLIDAVSGAHVWAERFDRELTDVFAVQDEIVSAIVGQLFGAVIDASVVSDKVGSAVDLTAHQHLLRGRSSWRRGAVVETMQHYRRAYAAAPGTSATAASLAFICAEDVWMQVAGIPIDELRVEALKLAEHAIAVDDGDAFAQHMVGSALLDLAELDRAKRHLELALTLNPHYPNSTINLGCTIGLMGDHRRGLELIDQAFRIDPRLPPAMQAVPFVVQCIAGQVEEARASLLRIQSPYAYLHAMMAVCFAACGRDGAARQQLQEFRTRRSPTFDVAGFTRMLIGWPRLPEDQARMRHGAQRLGIEV